MLRSCATLVVLAYLTGPAACSKKLGQLVDTTVDGFKPTLNPIVGLDDLKLGWQWRHWLVFHNQANLTCLWGSVHPLESLVRGDEPTEVAGPSGVMLVNAKLSSAHLGFRFDSCVLKVDDKEQAEPIWGELPENVINFEMQLAVTPNSCEGTVSKLEAQSPTIAFGHNNKILKELEDHGESLAELTEAIANNIQRSINHELTKYIGQKIAFPVNLCD